MFTRKLLGGLALAAAVANADNNQNCHSVKGTDSVFDLTRLENRTTDYYERTGFNFNGNVSWNYCSEAYPGIYARYKNGSTDETLANTELVNATDKLNSFGDVIGVSFYSTSDTVCRDNSQKTLVIRTELTCDADKTDEPVSSDFSVSYSDCGYTVVLSHAAGCPYDPTPLSSNAVEENLALGPTFRSGKQIGKVSKQQLADIEAERTEFDRKSVSFSSSRKIGGNVEGYYGLEWVFGGTDTPYTTTFRSGKIQGKRDKAAVELLADTMRSDDDLVSFGSSRNIGTDKEEEEEWNPLVAWEDATDQEKWAVMVGVVCTFVATCFLALIIGCCFGFCCSDKIGMCGLRCCPSCFKCYLRCKGATAAQADALVEMGNMKSPWDSKGKGDDDTTA